MRFINLKTFQCSGRKFLFRDQKIFRENLDLLTSKSQKIQEDFKKTSLKLFRNNILKENIFSKNSGKKFLAPKIRVIR